MSGWPGGRSVLLRSGGGQINREAPVKKQRPIRCAGEWRRFLGFFQRGEALWSGLYIFVRVDVVVEDGMKQWVESRWWFCAARIRSGVERI